MFLIGLKMPKKDMKHVEIAKKVFMENRKVTIISELHPKTSKI